MQTGAQVLRPYSNCVVNGAGATSDSALNLAFADQLERGVRLVKHRGAFLGLPFRSNSGRGIFPFAWNGPRLTVSSHCGAEPSFKVAEFEAITFS